MGQLGHPDWDKQVIVRFIIAAAYSQPPADPRWGTSSVLLCGDSHQGEFPMSAQIVLLPVFVLGGLTFVLLLAGSRRGSLAGDEAKARDIALSQSDLPLATIAMTVMASNAAQNQSHCASGSSRPLQPIRKDLVIRSSRVERRGR